MAVESVCCAAGMNNEAWCFQSLMKAREKVKVKVRMKEREKASAKARTKVTVKAEPAETVLCIKV